MLRLALIYSQLAPTSARRYLTVLPDRFLGDTLLLNLPQTQRSSESCDGSCAAKTLESRRQNVHESKRM